MMTFLNHFNSYTLWELYIDTYVNGKSLYTCFLIHILTEERRAPAT